MSCALDSSLSGTTFKISIGGGCPGVRAQGVTPFDIIDLISNEGGL